MWLQENGWTSLTTYSQAARNAALGGHFEVLKWLKEIGCQMKPESFSCAVQGGHMEIMKWLHENRCPFDYRSVVTAVCNDQLEELKWLRDHRVPWPPQLHYTLPGKHFEVHLFLSPPPPHKLQTNRPIAKQLINWAMENGCSISDDASFCTKLAEAGLLDLGVAVRARLSMG